MGMMTAIKSFKDINMVYLDILSGILGLILFQLIKNGINNYKFSISHTVLLVLISIIFFGLSLKTLYAISDNNFLTFSDLINSILFFMPSNFRLEIMVFAPF